MLSVPQELQEAIVGDLGERFRIESLLGSGTHSLVYLAHEVAFGRPVALKVLPLGPPQEPVNPHLASVFERVAGATAALRHSHLVRIYDFGTSPGYLWYAMEYAGERSLANMLRDSGPLDPDNCLRVVEQVASALDFMHRRTVAHGNLKSSHVFIASGDWVRLSDLNLNRVLEVWRTIEEGEPGTPALEEAVAEHRDSPPEALRADVHALASLAYECLSGNPAAPRDEHEDDEHEDMEPARRLKGPVPLTEIRQDIPAPLAYTIQRVLVRGQNGDPADVLDFVTALHGGTRLPRPAQAARTTALRRDQPRVLMFDEIEHPRSVFPGLHRFQRKGFIIGFSALAIAVAAILVWQRQPTGPLQSPSAAHELMAPRTPAEAARPEDAQPGDPSPEITAEQTELRGAQPPSQVSGADITAEQAEPQEAPTPAEVSEEGERVSSPEPITPRPAAGTGATAGSPGQLFVNATPWGELYVDGQPVGNTPLLDFAIAPGTHVIRIVREGYEPYEAEIRVAAGQELRLTNIVLTRRQP